MLLALNRRTLAGINLNKRTLLILFHLHASEVGAGLYQSWHGLGHRHHTMRASIERLDKHLGFVRRNKQLWHIGCLQMHKEVLLYIANLRFNSSNIMVEHHADILFVSHRNSDDCLRLASNRIAEVTAVDSSELHISSLHHLIEETHEDLIGIATTFVDVIA